MGDNASLKAARPPYPWSKCTNRFLIRLSITTAILIVFLILALIFAFGIAWAGIAEKMFATLRIAALLLPLWALSAFVPPMKTWDRLPVTSLAIVGTCMLIYVTLFFSAPLLMLKDRPFSAPEPGAALAKANREAGIAACKNDLNAISSPIAVDSLLIDSGFVGQSTLRDLLGRKGLRFVELRARNLKDWQGTESFGAAAFSGNRAAHFNVSSDVKFIRLSYSTRGDPACTGKAALGLEKGIGSEPISPDACVRTELDQQSHASHILKAVPADSTSSLIKWAVLEQATGKTLAALTAGDTPEFPDDQDDGALDERKTIDGDLVSCRSAHYSLMRLMYGPPRKPDDRLNLGRRTLSLDLETADLTSSEAWEKQEAPEEVVTDFRTRHVAKSGPTWNEGYREAQQTGWGSYADYVIDFGTGNIIEAAPYKHPFRWEKIRGSRKGFMVAWKMKHSKVALAHFGLYGQLLWKRKIVADKPVADHLGDFELQGMEWDDNQVRLYGFRPNAQNNHFSETSVLTVETPATVR